MPTLPRSTTHSLLILCIGFSLLLSAHAYSEARSIISFGSCLRQWNPQPIFKAITQLQPSAFIFLGDNVYSDVGAYLLLPTKLRFPRAYQSLAESEDYQEFLQSCRDNHTQLLATWDDHDYGKNDGGSEFEYKAEAKQHFQQFFRISDKQFASTEGVYQSYWLAHADKTIQVLLLDTRSFRSPLVRAPSNTQCPKTHNGQNADPAASILGEQQWQWLGEQLHQAADLRIIASSIQVVPSEHCYEKWANFPLERQRLFKLIKDSKATGVVLISGDRHLAEISLLPSDRIGYPVYEITSSGLNSAMGTQSQGNSEANKFRATSSNVLENNFGIIELIGSGNNTQLVFQIRLEDGSIAQSLQLPLQNLGFPAGTTIKPE